jgi:putative Holliday junction resolvase
MLLPLVDLPNVLTPGQRLLGLDVGDKTVGMAISDQSLSVASPIGTIRRGKIDHDVQALAAAYAEYGVGALVVGLPLNMDGSEGPRAQSVRAFIRNVDYRKAVLGCDVRAVLWDERLSTAAVQRFMTAEADMTRKRRGQVVDKMAAAFILQGALDALSYRRRQSPPVQGDIVDDDDSL